MILLGAGHEAGKVAAERVTVKEKQTQREAEAKKYKETDRGRDGEIDRQRQTQGFFIWRRSSQHLLKSGTVFPRSFHVGGASERRRPPTCSSSAGVVQEVQAPTPRKLSHRGKFAAFCSGRLFVFVVERRFGGD